MVPEKICSGVRWNGGELLLKIWIKTRKIVGSAALLFRLRSSFYKDRGGGIGGPNSPYGALRSPGKFFTEPLLSNSLQSSCMFFTITFHTVVRAVIRKTDFKRG